MKQIIVIGIVTLLFAASGQAIWGSITTTSPGIYSERMSNLAGNVVTTNYYGDNRHRLMYIYYKGGSFSDFFSEERGILNVDMVGAQFDYPSGLFDFSSSTRLILALSSDNRGCTDCVSAEGTPMPAPGTCLIFSNKCLGFEDDHIYFDLGEVGDYTTLS